MFPFIENLQVLADSGKYSREELTNRYYKAVTDKDKNLHSWKNWKLKGNEERMKKFRDLIERML
jgi:hypothetical protein